MSQEYQEEPGDPTEETEVVEETAEETPPQPDGGQPPASQPDPDAQPRFSQKQLNAFLASERRKWERSRGAGGAPGGQPPAPRRETPTPATAPFDDATMQGLQRVIDAAVAPFRQAAVQQEIDRSISNFKTAHPDVDTKEKLDEVLDVVLELGPEVVEKGDLSKLLNYAYGQWKWGKFDLEAHTNAKIQEALSGKAAKNRTAPNLQGGGGKAPVTPSQKKKSDPRDWSEEDRKMRELIEEGQANQ